MNDFIIDFRRLVIESINANFPAGVKNIYVVGSFSSGEITVLRDAHSAEVYMSDIDLMVDVDLLSFLKCRITNVAQKLSETLTNRVISKGVKTIKKVVVERMKHVSKSLPQEALMFHINIEKMIST